MDVFYTLHDFMVATKASIYALMALILAGVGGFWFFLTGRDPREEGDD
ncbi:HMC operon ORF 4 protein [Candidatus Desulfarcum epimagneticum]|uniref:HMC operon ORF 4 protein n=1 Tax=uncultured Desulfobacteraceae bacterium TaxID=218296 RepID=A0A484HDP8_9BACT|nr:HMC operon ORF 4 protein [uncultured Desulfobacteraceae bacterium]